MDSVAPATGTALLLLVAFVLPGFITVVAREATYVVRDATTPFERLLLSLSYSVRIYAALFVLVLALGWHTSDVSAFSHGHKALWEYGVFGGLALFVLPLSISECGRRWRRSEHARPWALRFLRISEGHSTPSGWDHFFASNRAALVRITLDDRRVVGGYYGEQSLAAYSADIQDLFLEQRWELDEDGWFTRPAPSSLGLWVPHEHIVSVELYEQPMAPPSKFDRALGAALAAAATVSILREDGSPTGGPNP